LDFGLQPKGLLQSKIQNLKSKIALVFFVDFFQHDGGNTGIISRAESVSDN